MFGRRKPDVEVAETEQVVERTAAEREEQLRSHREYCVEIDKRRHEVAVQERGKARQEYMPGWWIRQVAFKARARQASTDRLLRLPVKSG